MVEFVIQLEITLVATSLLTVAYLTTYCTKEAAGKSLAVLSFITR